MIFHKGLIDVTLLRHRRNLATRKSHARCRDDDPDSTFGSHHWDAQLYRQRPADAGRDQFQMRSPRRLLGIKRRLLHHGRRSELRRVRRDLDPRQIRSGSGSRWRTGTARDSQFRNVHGNERRSSQLDYALRGRWWTVSPNGQLSLHSNNGTSFERFGHSNRISRDVLSLSECRSSFDWRDNSLQGSLHVAVHATAFDGAGFHSIGIDARYQLFSQLLSSSVSNARTKLLADDWLRDWSVVVRSPQTTTGLKALGGVLHPRGAKFRSSILS